MPQLAVPAPRAIAAYAGFWLRFAAALIDLIVYWTLVGIALGLLVGLMLESLLSAGPDAEAQLYWVFILVLAGITAWLGWFFYHALMESTDWQGSLGKKALGLYVTRNDGAALTFGRALGRNLGKTISDMTFFVGYIMAGFTERKQALHDIIADCLVLRRS